MRAALHSVLRNTNGVETYDAPLVLGFVLSTAASGAAGALAGVAVGERACAGGARMEGGLKRPGAATSLSQVVGDGG